MIEARRLVRARRLLAERLDHHRALIGPVSDDWLREEVERTVRIATLRPALRDHRESGIAADADPATRVNTNRLPKLEPTLDAGVLGGVLLYGARLYGAGTPDPERGISCAEIGNDLVLAAMLIDTRGHVAAERIAEELGADVAERREELGVALDAFERDRSAPAAPLACAIAAIEASRLRLVARAAGDRIFATLSDAQLAELRRAGIEEPFCELPHLRRAFDLARAAVELPGVDEETLRLPIAGQLLLAVENVLERGMPAEQLVGRYGQAIHHFHGVLPLMYRYSSINRRTQQVAGERVETEGLYALATLHLTGLEVTRYLHKVRRKGLGTAAGHSFIVSSRLAPVLPERRIVAAIAASDCHDVVEDGSFEVSGYDQTLELFAARFGAPLAALVAEVTDSLTRADGPLKAAAFRNQPRLPMPEELYNAGRLDAVRSVATDPETPYTVVGALLKLADTATTQEEGLRAPELMGGPWSHSGARIFWDLYSRGLIVRPIVERFAAELEQSCEPAYASRAGALPPRVLEGLREMLSWVLSTADAYALQNIGILADEHALTADEREELLAAFRGDGARFDALAERLLTDDRLDAELARRGWSATARLHRDGRVERDLDKLVDYHDTWIWRRGLRERLGLTPLAR